MLANTGKLSRKIVGMLVVFFVFATGAIGLTLLISWQLEGVAAAINDAVNKVAELTQATMGEAAGGLQLPPGIKLPGMF